jgi:hypothetical protein
MFTVTQLFPGSRFSVGHRVPECGPRTFLGIPAQEFTCVKIQVSEETEDISECLLLYEYAVSYLTI